MKRLWKYRNLSIVLPSVLSMILAMLILTLVVGINMKIVDDLNRLLAQSGTDLVRVYNEEDMSLQLFEKIREEYTGDVTFATSGMYFRADSEEYLVERVGVTQNFFEVRGLTIRAGRGFLLDEYNLHSPVAILGAHLKDAFFPAMEDEAIIGQQIKLVGQKYTVIGVVEEVDNSFGPVQFVNRQMFIPYTLFAKPDLSMIWLKSKGESLDQLKDNLAQKTGYTQIVLEYVHNEFSIIEPLKKSLIRWLTVLAFILFILAEINMVSLFLIRVNQQIREIGLHKALGAKNRDIVCVYLQRYLLLSSISGFGAFLLILLLKRRLEFYFHIGILLSPFTVIIVFFSIMSVGLVVGLVPALHSVRIQPMQAIRNLEWTLKSDKKNFTLREILPVVNVLVGIAALTIILTINDGMTSNICENIKLLGGSNVIVVKSFSFDSPYLRQPPKFSSAEYLALKNLLPEDQIGLATFERIRDYDPPLNLSRVNFDQIQLTGLYTQIGRLFSEKEFAEDCKVAVLGHELFTQMGEKVLNEGIFVYGEHYQIIGVLEPRKELAGHGEYNFNNRILIPYFTWAKAEPKFFVKITHGEIGEVIKQIEITLHQLQPDKAPPLIDKPSDRYLQFAEKFKESIRVLGLITIFALVISAVGIYNILLVRVLTVRKEIAIQRVVGASRLRIIFEFLGQSLELVLWGGVLGMLVGYAITFICLQIWDMELVIQWQSIVLIFGLDLLLGLSAGSVPVIKAVRVEPREVLISD